MTGKEIVLACDAPHHVLNRYWVYVALEAKLNAPGVRFKKDWSQSRTYRKLCNVGLYPTPSDLKCAFNVLKWNHRPRTRAQLAFLKES